MKICNHKVVSLQFAMKNDAGDVVDSSEDGGALIYLHGEENIVQALENVLEGKSVGDSIQVTLEAADAYGEIDAELIEVVDAEMFEGVDNIEPGMEFESEEDEESGEIQYVRIVEVNGNQVTVDGNHPLAGMRLHFDMTVESIRAATDDEIDHGHPHSDDEGCCGDDDCSK
ncbi:MAG: peptidylprolyl isomerase [Zetaproteobacteria bacterium]|nr:peptidylprolyl isomerase [Zetaproteobacteria bacterium]